MLTAKEAKAISDKVGVDYAAELDKLIREEASKGYTKAVYILKHDIELTQKIVLMLRTKGYSVVYDMAVEGMRVEISWEIFGYDFTAFTRY